MVYYYYGVGGQGAKGMGKVPESDTDATISANNLHLIMACESHKGYDSEFQILRLDSLISYHFIAKIKKNCNIYAILSKFRLGDPLKGTAHYILLSAQ